MPVTGDHRQARWRTAAATTTDTGAGTGAGTETVILVERVRQSCVRTQVGQPIRRPIRPKSGLSDSLRSRRRPPPLEGNVAWD
jgi:hypothetical protein